MASKVVMFRSAEEQTHAMAQSMQLSSQIKKRTFTSGDEEASYSEYYPIIPGDVMSVKELLPAPKFPRHRTWEVLKETMENDVEVHERDQWTMFGNEAESIEIDVLRNQQMARTRLDRMALRQELKKKQSVHMKYLEDLSAKGPDFPIPLRPHTVWEGMAVKLSCTVQGCPEPTLTWYKDGIPLSQTSQPWRYNLVKTFGLSSLHIRRCCAEDAGEYKVVAKSSLGEATTFATLHINRYEGPAAGLEVIRAPTPVLPQEAQFGSTFNPTFMKEGETLTLRCTFTSPLLPAQDVTWFRDGVQLRSSSRLELKTLLNSASVSLKGVHKENEGVYKVRLRTWEGYTEHSAYVYVKDAAAVVVGGPGSPLHVEVSDVNRDYAFLRWQPPSADGAFSVLGYIIERCNIGTGKWEPCNETPQKPCYYPVTGLSDGTLYQFRVSAVNKAGIGRPSKPTEPILTSDPNEPSRTMVVKVDRGREIIITKDELESQIRVPFPPTGVCVCEQSDTYAVLSWTEPEPRGRELLTFNVERSIAGQNRWHLANLDVVVSSPRFVAFGLQKDVAYEFRVRSVNKYGVSSPSEPSAPVTLAEAEAPPAPPRGVQATRDTDSSVLLQWAEPKDTKGVLGYYLYYSEMGKSDWRTINNKPVNGNRFTVHGLMHGKQYEFLAKSVGRGGNSKYSEESEPILVKAAIYVPGSPSAIALLHCSGSEMLLNWRAPGYNGGSPVTGYYLDSRGKARTWREVNVKPVKERLYTVCNLEEGQYYQFHVFAANVVGVGKPSQPSDFFLCEEWTMPEPGCAYDLFFREVRSSSLVLMWSQPVYTGQSEITGYLVQYSEGEESEDWQTANEEPTPDTHLKVSGLKAGYTYRLRVFAVNEAGEGMESLPSEPVTALTQPGTKEVEIGVDNDGFIFMAFETCEEMSKGSQFVWSKNYSEAIDAGRVRLETKDNRSILTFIDATEEDLGLYTVVLSDNNEVSSSYEFTAEDLERLKELSWHILHPLIQLKTGWTVEVSEQGNVRLWLQTEPLSNAAELHLILNDREISSTPARKINFDKASGLLEILFDQLSRDDEGSYTAQLRDGRAKNQFTLVLVDEKFRQTFAKSQANRRDWKRKAGPHFEQFLSWVVTPDCELIMTCKVTNLNKDSVLVWYKDGVELKQVVTEASGLSTLLIPQVTKGEAGVYRAVVSDSRGEDDTEVVLLNEEFDRLMQHLSRACALSASPMRIQCTAEGFKLYCSMKYYLSYLKASWHFKERRIDLDERTKPGCSMLKLWIEIKNPTEADKGKYILEMHDGIDKHTRQLDLSGQVFDDALLEYQRLKQVAVAERNRARVTKGLPDVVAIMEEKSLCLTCFCDGEPAPEMFWLKNDREVTTRDQYHIAKEHKCTTLTINSVAMEDSGTYSIFVRNQYGTETVNVTVSVYRHGDKPPPEAVEL